MTPSIYINLEDDVSKIIDRLKRESSPEVVLVCPKRCFLFNDSINLRLLKKQVDLMKKTVSILTMDERGQMYAKDAGFTLRFLPKSPQSKSMSDIGITLKPRVEAQKPAAKVKKQASAASKPAVKIESEPEAVDDGPVVPLDLSEIKQTAKKMSRAVLPAEEELEEEVSLSDEKSSVAPQVSVQENIFPFEIEERYKESSAKSKTWKWVLAACLVAALGAAAFFFLFLPKGEVVLTPKNDVLVRDLEVSFGTTVKQPDPTKLVLPATQVAEDLEIKETIESQGKKEVGNRATGFVKIYNFTRLPLNLKAETTTLTLNGKNYNLVSDAMQIRPTGYKNSRTKEVDESTLVAPVEIISAEGGEGYNLPAGTRLEVSNKVFGSKPQLLYAKTDSPISGGTSRYLSVVSDQDLTAAQEQLKKEALSKVQAKLSGQNLVLPDDAYSLQVVQFSSDKAPGTQSPNFEAYAKLKVTGLAIDQSQLQQLIFSRINQTLSGNKTLDVKEGAYQLLYKTKNLDSNNQLGVLSVHFQGRVWYNLSASLETMAQELKSKTPDEVNETLSKYNEIDKIEVFLTPSWQKRLPLIVNNIKVRVQP
ncbi:MAG: hypothetical protein M1333_00065 [Patescibacteria group bacterium]|nr:hypothetical protein [Patescibacteria group bacterium]